MEQQRVNYLGSPSRLLLLWITFGNIAMEDLARAGVSSAESEIVQVDTRNIYDAWAQTFGLTGAAMDYLATPKNDGVTNLLKYAFNMDPTVQDTAPVTATSSKGLPALEIRTTEGFPRLHLIAMRRKNDPTLSYVAEFSTNLTDWQKVVAPQALETIPLDSTWEKVVFRDPIASPSVPRRFGRISVLLGVP